jgi:hypothetical protein
MTMSGYLTENDCNAQLNYNAKISKDCNAQLNYNAKISKPFKFTVAQLHK